MEFVKGYEMDKIGVGCASITELEKKYVMEVLDTQRLSQGKFVAEFEQKFSGMHGKKYGVMCNSGTSAVHLALETLKEIDGWDETAEVLVPAITFIATSNACIHAGLKPVFVDVDLTTYNMDPDEIEKHITEHTKCIIPVHTFGMPCEMDRIMEIARRYGLRVIEDCAESHFARYRGRAVGSYGDISAFSTYVAHTITTGVGGVVCTDDSGYMEILRSLVAHGRACTCERCIASDGKSVCKKRMGTDIDRRFLFVRLGYSYRVGELEGALGLAQIERADEIMTKRKENAQYLTKRLKKYEGCLQLPECPDYIEHTYMMYPILVKKGVGIDRRSLIEFLEKNNVETRPMLPLLNQPVYKKMFGELEAQYPSAGYINENGFYVGCHHGLGQREMESVADLFDRYFACHITGKGEKE